MSAILQSETNLRNLLSAINTITGDSDDNLTSAIQRLINRPSFQQAIDSYLNRTLTAITINSSNIKTYAFHAQTSLLKVEITTVTQIETQAFRACGKLATMILHGDSVSTLDDVQALRYTPIEYRTGKIYVPDALVEEYKAATNWSTFADVIKPLSEYAGG